MNACGRQLTPRSFISGSGGTDVSKYDSSASTRISSSSTVPSLADASTSDEKNPLAGALRAAAGRTFSFGGRAKTPPLSVPPPPPPTHQFDEARSSPITTAPSSSAAPRLPDDDLDFGGFDEDFKDLLSDFNKRHSPPSHTLPNRNVSTHSGLDGCLSHR